MILILFSLIPESSCPCYEYFLDAFEGLMIWKMICDKTCKSRAVPQCVFLYVWLSWLHGGKFCHKICIDISCKEEIFVTTVEMIGGNADII